MKKSYMLFGLVALFVLYAGWAFADSITPYVDIAEARTARGSVQVKADESPTPEEIQGGAHGARLGTGQGSARPGGFRTRTGGQGVRLRPRR